MSTRSALAGAATTAVVVAALGNPATVDAVRDADNQALAVTLTGFANWDVADQPGDVVGLVAVRLGMTLLVVALLGALAGRSRSRGAAFVAGWGGLAVAAAAAGAAAYVYQVAVVLDGHAVAATYLDGMVLAANAGAAFGTWTGWLVGMSVALATRPARLRAPDASPLAGPQPAAEPAHRRITEPPPPWWAPTRVGDDTPVRPGPTAFPPGGLPPAVPGADAVPPSPPPAAPVGAEATHEMTTVSGDPHPSDPDATQPVGIPPAADDTGEAAPPQRDDAGPDATAALPPEPDETKQTPRQQD